MGKAEALAGTIVRRLKETYGERFDIIALGTNAIATAPDDEGSSEPGRHRGKTPSA